MPCPRGVEEVTSRSTQAYCCGWRRVQETMGSLASGIHFGHYIASTFNPEILVLNAALANILLRMGFSYARWKKGINVTIEKTMGNYNIKKLRIILLFKADFDANNKWIGRAVMYKAEQAHLLVEEQFGSHKFNRQFTNVLTNSSFMTLSASVKNWQHSAQTMQKVVTIR